jgi:hypothetical protein
MVALLTGILRGGAGDVRGGRILRSVAGGLEQPVGEELGAGEGERVSLPFAGP